MVKILVAPNDILSKKSSLVKNFDSDLTRLLNDMTKALEGAKDPIGVGLAAPQIGANLQIFISRPTEKSKIGVFINPKIVSEGKTLKKKNKNALKKLEGCLSLPNVWGEVKRSSEVTLEYLDKNGKKHLKTFTGFMAIIIQHEMDHLDGILFPRRVLEQNGVLYQSTKDENGQDYFEELKI